MTSGLVCLLVGLAAGAPGQTLLKQGIRDYRAGADRTALEALTAALEQNPKGATRAKIHLYIGLIQFAFGFEQDAKSSFKEAIAHHSKIRFPRIARAKKARRLFSSLKRADSGRRGRSKIRRKRPTRDPPPSEAPPPAEEPPADLPAPLGIDGSIAADSPPPVGLAAPPPPLPDSPAPPPPDRLDLDASTEAPDPGVSTGVWVLGGVAVAAVVVGSVLGGLAARDGSAAQDEPVAVQAQDLYKAGVTKRTGMFISFGIAVAAGGTAIGWGLSD